MPILKPKVVIERYCLFILKTKKKNVQKHFAMFYDERNSAFSVALPVELVPYINCRAAVGIGISMGIPVGMAII